MIRTLRDEVERYGHYSLAAESMYDIHFMGLQAHRPDLARVGGRYSDQWAEHLINPRSVVPEKHHAGYPCLATRKLDAEDVVHRLGHCASSASPTPTRCSPRPDRISSRR